jgi:hypothetical protein
MNKCVCGHYHCPNCMNQMDELYCDLCNIQYDGTEVFEPIDVDISELFE